MSDPARGADDPAAIRERRAGAGDVLIVAATRQVLTEILAKNPATCCAPPKPGRSGSREHAAERAGAGRGDDQAGLAHDRPDAGAHQLPGAQPVQRCWASSGAPGCCAPGCTSCAWSQATFSCWSAARCDRAAARRPRRPDHGVVGERDAAGQQGADRGRHLRRGRAPAALDLVPIVITALFGVVALVPPAASTSGRRRAPSTGRSC